MRVQRLLIVGCGDVVRRALPELTRRWRVLALVRERDAALGSLGVVQIVGDLDRPQTLKRLAGIADAVLHSAPPADSGVDDTRTRRLIAALSRGSLPRRLVYISTTGVYGDCGGRLIDETAPLRPQTHRAHRRVAAERHLRRWGRKGVCRVSLLRAPGIYAADRLPLDRLRRGLPVFERGEDSQTNHIHAEDLAATCVAALRRGGANRVYNVCDDSDIAMGDWYDKLADAFALPRPPRRSRQQVMQEVPPIVLSFMNESRRLANKRLKQELKVQLRYPTVDRGIAAAKESKCSG